MKLVPFLLMRYQLLPVLLDCCPSLPFSVIGGSVTVVDASVDDGEFDGSVSIDALVPDPPPASVVVEGVAVEGALVDELVKLVSVDTFGCEDSCELDLLLSCVQDAAASGVPSAE